MEEFLKQLEALINTMAPDERERAAEAISFVINVVGRQHIITSGAFLKFMSNLAIYSGMGTMPKFWDKVRAKASKIGPHVTAVFQGF